jgi:hypothetical protein
MSAKIEAKTYTAQIYVGLRTGYTEKIRSLDEVRDICQMYVDEAGLCVSVTPTEFIYTSGREPGAVVGLIHYPRFPSTPSQLEQHALSLAQLLQEGLEQYRVSVVLYDRTVMFEQEVVA